MKNSSLLFPVLCVAALLPVPATRAGSMDMIAVAEQTNKGAMVAPPTADNPACYVAYDGGYIEAGDPIAGEKPPTAAAIGQTLRQVLAAQGYKPATAMASPSLLLVYHWGSINKDTIAIPRLNKLKPNLRARIYLAGSTREAATLENFLLSRKSAPIPNDWAPVPGFLTARIEDVLNVANDDRYFVIVSAYDYTAISRHEPALLWRVKLSARSVSSYMEEVLPSLISGGAPFFGRNLQEAGYPRVPLLPAVAANAEAPMPAPPPAIARQLDGAFVTKLVKQEHDLFAGEDVTDPAADGGGVPGAPSSSARVNPPAVPASLAGEIAGYRQEKLALQEALAARIKGQPAGADSRALIDSFNRDYADRIAELARTRDSIRDQLSRLASANTDPAAAGTLNALLKEYASDVQVLAPPAGGASR